MFCDPALPTEMKHCSFLEIWGQRQRHHPTLAGAQGAGLFLAKAKYMIFATGRRFFSLPLSCATPSDSVTLRVGVLPQQGLPIGTAGLLKHVKPRMCCLVEAQVEWKARGEAPERRHYLPLCALLFRVHSSEPQTCTMVLH